LRKISFFVFFVLIANGFAGAAVRDNNSVTRQNNFIQKNSVQRSANTDRISRSATVNSTTKEINSRDTLSTRSVTESNSPKVSARAATLRNNISQRNTVAARAATDTAISETRTGAAYEQCKTAYFTCMDQFCAKKNDDYRRCSCSDRVYDLTNVKTVMQNANDKLTAFTENLDSVEMTSEQATAMKTSSEGENALTSDSSSSKALLQAIMNSISGEDTTVGGKFSDLNSINLSFDTTNSFGTMDAGQAIATYNGKNLYNAIYGQCRNAVKADCNDASLQRAVTAYLMSVEQDCNTVQTSIDENKKKMTAAVREGSAMLDLARVENRQKHNSDDLTACLTNVESAIKSEEVCGANYHKCLDNGEFIDISTGAPIAGVVKFYELPNLLKFDETTNASEQKLAKNPSNRIFVQNFENKAKKFAQPSLDKCTEDADTVWSDYLDKAMLDIYYAQKAKVSEIKQGCFDFVSSCYTNGSTALTAAMAELSGDSTVLLQPDKITLNSAVCKEYVESCDNMFDGNIVKQYVESMENTDTLTACRAVVKQCFDKFGGTNYENFYDPTSGLFTVGSAPDWFTLCDGKDCTSYKSECAKQLAEVSSCSSKEMMIQAFGGFDAIPVDDSLEYSSSGDVKYGILTGNKLSLRSLRPSGVATEIYYQIIDTLSTQCTNLQGRFVELQFLRTDMYDNPENICLASFNKSNGEYYTLATLYGVGEGEDMCPRDYGLGVDTESWGACLCWENGARRSKWGKSVKCVAELPTTTEANDDSCYSSSTSYSLAISTDSIATDYWCTQGRISSSNQVCPFISVTAGGACYWNNGDDVYKTNVGKIPKGIL